MPRPPAGPPLNGRIIAESGDPQRYTRFVVIMKRVLFFTAVALILAVVAYSLQPREANRVAMSFARLSRVNNDLAMIKPRLHGTDSKGDPFVITAERAAQDGLSSRKARLYSVQADITLEKGMWISASAREGYLNADTNKLALWGDLSVFADNGYELHTPGAEVDLSTGQIAGHQGITGHGPGGALRADRFVFDRDSKTIHLMGNVQMQFFKHGAKS